MRDETPSNQPPRRSESRPAVRPHAPGAERAAPERIAGANARSFTGPDLVTWLVYEVEGSRVPGARGERCLVFDGGTALRRVWHYPADWRSLDDGALFELSWGR